MTTQSLIYTNNQNIILLLSLLLLLFTALLFRPITTPQKLETQKPKTIDNLKENDINWRIVDNPYDTTYSHAEKVQIYEKYGYKAGCQVSPVYDIRYGYYIKNGFPPLQELIREYEDKIQSATSDYSPESSIMGRAVTAHLKLKKLAVYQTIEELVENYYSQLKSSTVFCNYKPGSYGDIQHNISLIERLIFEVYYLKEGFTEADKISPIPTIQYLTWLNFGINIEDKKSENALLAFEAYQKFGYESDDRYNLIGYMEAARQYGVTEADFKSAHPALRYYAYSQLNKIEAGFDDPDSDIRMKCYNLLGYTQKSLTDPDFYIRTAAEQYFQKKSHQSYNKQTPKIDQAELDRQTANRAKDYRLTRLING